MNLGFVESELECTEEAEHDLKTPKANIVHEDTTDQDVHHHSLLFDLIAAICNASWFDYYTMSIGLPPYPIFEIPASIIHY